VSSIVKVNVGCGKTVAAGWINIDKSPSVLLSALPWLRLLSALPWLRKLLRSVGILTPEQAEGFPSGVVHADVAKRIPLSDKSVDFIYGSHMIEHLSRWEALIFVRECRRVLRDGGVLRLTTPDLEMMVHDYLNGSSPFSDSATTAADAFCMEYRAYANAELGIVKSVIRKLLSGDSHQWLYDHESIEALLHEGGFPDVTSCTYRRGRTPDLTSVEGRQRGLFVEAEARPA
jgi:predicted SAM-dependent methyltransferase